MKKAFNKLFSGLDMFTRPSIQYCKLKYGRKPVTVIELGVGQGLNSLNILNQLNVETLYAIDPVLRDDVCAELEMKGNVVFFNDEAEKEIIYNQIPEVDICYVDGNHQYPFVMRDLEIYWDKVTGVLCGHDFYGSHQDVCQAVVQFCLEKHIRFQAWGHDWWIEKKQIEEL